MDNKTNSQKDPAIAAVSMTAGAAAGMAATSGTAIAAAGAGASGFSGYVAGVTILAANAACETAAAVALGTLAAAPVIGGLLGYTVYRVIKSAVKNTKKTA